MSDVRTSVLGSAFTTTFFLAWRTSLSLSIDFVLGPRCGVVTSFTFDACVGELITHVLDAFIGVLGFVERVARLTMGVVSERERQTEARHLRAMKIGSHFVGYGSTLCTRIYTCGSTVTSI